MSTLGVIVRCRSFCLLGRIFSTLSLFSTWEMADYLTWHVFWHHRQAYRTFSKLQCILAETVIVQFVSKLLTDPGALHSGLRSSLLLGQRVEHILALLRVKTLTDAP